MSCIMNLEFEKREASRIVKKLFFPKCPVQCFNMNCNKQKREFWKCDFYKKLRQEQKEAQKSKHTSNDALRNLRFLV